MTIETVCLIDSSGSENAEGRFSGTYNYLVNSDDQADQAFTVLRDSDASVFTNGVPSTWTPLTTSGMGNDEDLDLYVLNKEASFIGPDKETGYWCWNVSASVGSLVGAGVTIDDLITNPVLRPVKFTPGSEVYDDLFQQEFEPYPGLEPTRRFIVNSAKDPFIPSPVVQRRRPLWFFDLNVAGENNVRLLQATFIDAMNADVWRGALPRTILCRDVSAGDEVHDGPYRYYPVRMTFAVKAPSEQIPTWDIQYLNQGNKYIVNPGAGPPLEKKKACKDADGAHSTGLCNLDGAGERMADDQEPMAWPDASAPYVRYKSVFYSSLGF